MKYDYFIQTISKIGLQLFANQKNYVYLQNVRFSVYQVGVFDNYINTTNMEDEKMKSEIIRLKKEKNAVI